MILFDWGTYNALTKLPLAATLGMKLTEIPPYDFSRRARGEDYFRRYAEFAREAFTTIVAHAPYYNVVSTDREVMERSWRALVAAARKAKIAGAEIFNLHLGWRAYMDERDLELAGELLKKLVKEMGPDGYVSVEIPYTRRMLGVWDEVKALREMVGNRLIVSLQLENVWMLETGASETGDFEGANRVADKTFWLNILEKALGLTEEYVSLRFSQVIGFAIGSRILKKRVPLGRGYPDLDPLASALAEFMVRRVRGKGLKMRMHIIYTGRPQTKYKDTITLFASIMREAVDHLS
ncbi:MAG: TIM barrel protein [Desulfurococcales archaeon]|nr:TIM barrel protein [Desulfurococcales archaeon]